MTNRSVNIDEATVLGFGEAWASFTQEELDPTEQQKLFDQYFSVFPFNELPEGAEGFDRYRSFYSMRTHSLDRFGIRLEQRFSRAEIDAMMRRCGLTDIRFREGPPFWVACGRKA